MQSFFVSSTFKDMQGERDALHRLVMPQLQEMAAGRGESVQFVDLRWGISTTDLDSDAGAKKILSACLNEIRQCKPYMIVLLGERYGWMPSPDLLQGAAEEMDFPAATYEMSVTELEIQYGMYLARNELDHCIFCLRDPVPDQALSEEQRQIYLSGSEDDRQRMQRLKEKILQAPGSVVIRYHLDWDAEAKNFTGYDRFAEQLTAALTEILLRQWKGREALTWQQRQREEDALLVSMHQSTFIGRDSELEELKRDLYRHEILILEGEGGSGKSALLAQLSLEIQRDDYQTELFCCGNSADCMNTIQLLRLMCWKLAPYIAEDALIRDLELRNFACSLCDGEESPDSLTYSDEEWRDYYQQLMKAYNGPYLVFFLDAIDQLIPDKALYESWFIPALMPAKCRLVISTTGAVPVNPLALPNGSVGISSKTVYLKPPQETDLRAILNSRFQAEHKQISRPVADRLLQNPCSQNMLGMEIMVRRLVMLGQKDFQEIAALEKKMDGSAAIDTYLISLIGQMSDSLEQLITDYFEAVCQFLDESKYLASVMLLNIIGNLWHGISASQLEQFAAFIHSDGRCTSIPEDHIWKTFWDPILFSRLKRYLGKLLIRRRDGQADFSHRLLRESILRRSASGFCAYMLRYWLFFEPRESTLRQENILILTRIHEAFQLAETPNYRPDPESLGTFFADTICKAGTLSNSGDSKEAAEGNRQLELLSRSILNDLSSSSGWAHLDTYCAILQVWIERGAAPNDYTVWFLGSKISRTLASQGEVQKSMAVQLLYCIIAALHRQKDTPDTEKEAPHNNWTPVSRQYLLTYHVRCLRLLAELKKSYEENRIQKAKTYGYSPQMLLEKGTQLAQESLRLYPEKNKFRSQLAIVHAHMANLSMVHIMGIRKSECEQYAENAFSYAAEAARNAIRANAAGDNTVQQTNSTLADLLYVSAMCIEALLELLYGQVFFLERIRRLTERIYRETLQIIEEAGDNPDSLPAVDTARFINAAGCYLQFLSERQKKQQKKWQQEAVDLCYDYYHSVRNRKNRARTPAERESFANLALTIGDIMLEGVIPQSATEGLQPGPDGYNTAAIRRSILHEIITREGAYIQAQARGGYDDQRRYAALLCFQACYHENISPENCLENCTEALAILTRLEELEKKYIYFPVWQKLAGTIYSITGGNAQTQPGTARIKAEFFQMLSVSVFCSCTGKGRITIHPSPVIPVYSLLFCQVIQICPIPNTTAATTNSQ